MPTFDPVIDAPDEHEVGDELYCWMPGNANRECNGGCVAFEPACFDDPSISSCKTLNAIRSLAISFGIQNKLVKKDLDDRTARDRQDIVSNLPQPPKVM